MLLSKLTNLELLIINMSIDLGVEILPMAFVMGEMDWMK